MLRRLPFHYGWLIVCMGFLALVAAMGIRSSFGVYVLPWQEEYELSRSHISLISTLSLIVYGVGNIFVGRIAEKIGVRFVLSCSIFLIGLALVLGHLSTQFWQMFFLYGVVASLGFSGASNVTASMAVTRWFTDKRRAFVLSLMVAGMCVGQMLLVPLQVLLVSSSGWRWTFFWFGIIYILVVVPLLWAFVRSNPASMGLAPIGAREEAAAADWDDAAKAKRQPPPGPSHPVLGVKDLLRNPYFWLMVFPYFFCGFSDSGLIDNHLVPFAHGRAMDETAIATMISVLAIFNLGGTILAGYLSDRFNRGYILAGMYVFRGVSMFVALALGGGWVAILFAILFGVTDFANIAPTSTLAASLFQRYSVGFVIGITSFSHQVGAACGAYVPALVFDLTGGYETVFAALGVIHLLGAAACYWIGRRQEQIRNYPLLRQAQ